MHEEMTVIYTAANAQEAHLLRNALQEQGIAAWVSNELLQGALGELPLGWASLPQVVVAEQDAEKARQVAMEFQDEVTRHRTDQTSEEQRPPADWTQWPTCPRCRRRRQTVCPVCQTGGNQFPMAEFLVDAAPLEPTQPSTPGSGRQPEDTSHVLLICPNCDETFEPEFYRFCEDCGHDFGSGIELQQPAGEPINFRVVAVAAVLVLLGAALLIYAATLLY